MIQTQKISTLIASVLLVLNVPLGASTETFEKFLLAAGKEYNSGPAPGGVETDDPFSTNKTTYGVWALLNGLGLSNTYTETDTGEPYFWANWEVSKVMNTQDGTYSNQHAAYPGGGSSSTGIASQGEHYGIGFWNAFDPSDRLLILIPEGRSVQSMHVSNTTYAALTMRDGNAFARPFAQDDWFMIEVMGFDVDGEKTGSINFYLADFRSQDPEEHYILDHWELVDLRSLGMNAREIEIIFQSSDVGAWGINHPTYLAIDNLSFTVAALQDATALPNDWNASNWFGLFYDLPEAWTYSEDWNWVHIAPGSIENSFYAWHPELEWLHMSEANHPLVLDFKRNLWLQHMGSGLVYNYQSGQYETFE